MALIKKLIKESEDNILLVNFIWQLGPQSFNNTKQTKDIVDFIELVFYFLFGRLE